MTNVVKRYLIERSETQIARTFQHLSEVCARDGIDQITLVVPKKGGWENSVIADFLGERPSRALVKGEAVALGNGGPKLRLESAQTFRSGMGAGIVVGAHISISDMAKIDDDWQPRAIVYMPWNEEEARELQAIWMPETIGPSTATPADISLPAAVEAALAALTQDINLGTGLGHPSDKARAVHVLDRLKSEGHAINPGDIKRWALRHHWSSNAASELEVVALKVNR